MEGSFLGQSSMSDRDEGTILHSSSLVAEIKASIELNAGRDLASDPRVGMLLSEKKTQAVPSALAFFLAVIRKPKLSTLRKVPRPTNSIFN
jgi:hypothetical protein